MSEDRMHERMKGRSAERGNTRARRTRILVVGSGDGMRDLATHARRKVAHVVEVATLYDAVDECRRAPASEPIAAAFISADCEHYDAAATVDAFMRVDPALPLILAVSAEQDDLTAESTSEGFEDSIRLPVRDEELARILDDVGAIDHAAPVSGSAPAAAALHAAPVEHASIPSPKNVVEEIVGRAQERLHERTADRPPVRPPQQTTHSPVPPTTPPATPPTSAPPRGQPPRGGPRPSQSAPFQMPSAPRPAGDHPHDGPPSDIDLVRAVLDGHDVQGAAMRVLRHHLGSADVRFVAEPRPGEEAAVELDRRGLRQVAVTRHAPGSPNSAGAHPASDATRPYGILISRTIDETHLRAWANWLSSWLDLDEQHQELRRLAWTDELTGAGNRRAFDKLLADTIHAAQRDWRFFGLMLFDIDDFKRYNDDYGHDTGDEVLKEIVELLRACIRRGDHIFRIGGDEFAVLFCDPEGPRRGGTLDRESATAIANRFQRAVAELSLDHIGLDGPGTVSVSTGFASFPWHGLDPLALYRAADGFCLDSKRAGKNQITFGPGLHGAHGPNPGHPHGSGHGDTIGGPVQ